MIPKAASAARGPDTRLSHSIAIARVLCILGVVYVHAWTGRTGEELAAMASWQEGLRWVLMEGLGKSAVPLLGIVSGWLVAGSARTRHWRAHVAVKARTILLPMVAWNIVAILLVCGAALLFHLKAPMPASLEWTAQEVLLLTRNPDINVQMPFLRDLFLCMLAAPLLVRLPGRALAIIGIGAAICSVAEWGQPLLLRPAILTFFALGMLARRGGWAERAAALPYAGAVAPFLLLLPFKVVLSLPAVAAPGLHPHAMAAFDLMIRLAAALAFWRTAWALAGSGAAESLRSVERYAFFLFCSHLILIWLLGPVIGGFTGPLGAPAYPLFLLAQPLLVLGASMTLGAALARFWPRAAALLSGGRLGSAPPRQRRRLLAVEPR
ncbi:acyltransferase [Sphingobium aquiterrae]|uniref:acyltransferase family protein n=1 Tax=Sphingobium aquiterrae TaxID=2038656 RepID=UPI00301AE642